MEIGIGSLVHYFTHLDALSPIAAVVTRAEGKDVWVSLLEHQLPAVVCRGPVPHEGAAQPGEHFWRVIEK